MPNKQHYLFIIRNNPSFIHYIKRAWRYFLSDKRTTVKIVIRKDNVFIHISQAYCVILNDLEWMFNNPNKYIIECSKKSLEWFKQYKKIR